MFHQVAVATSSTPLQTTHSALNRGPRGYMYDPRATTEPPNYRTNRGYSRGKTKARAGTRKLQTHPEEYYASLFNACEYASMMHRQLRLRSAPTQPTSPSHAKPAPFVFRPDLVQSATKERMVGFANTYSTLPGHLKEKMQHVNDRLLPFGYDLFASYFSPDAQVQRKKFNALTAWEL
ncbi:hypothetical protein EON65_23140 [archaeon]|nr:MAG: hypothetical protein EON65_23140 [archaeon]